MGDVALHRRNNGLSPPKIVLKASLLPRDHVEYRYFQDHPGTPIGSGIGLQLDQPTLTALAEAEAIAKLEPYLGEVRERDKLREARPGIFYLKSRAFLHFHEDKKGLFADVKLTHDFSRFPVNTPKQQAKLLERIDRFLSKR